MNTTVIVIFSTGAFVGLCLFMLAWSIETMAEYREYVNACKVEYHIHPMLLIPWLRGGKVWA